MQRHYQLLAAHAAKVGTPALSMELESLRIVRPADRMALPFIGWPRRQLPATGATRARRTPQDTPFRRGAANPPLRRGSAALWRHKRQTITRMTKESGGARLNHTYAAIGSEAALTDAVCLRVEFPVTDLDLAKADGTSDTRSPRWMILNHDRVDLVRSVLSALHDGVTTTSPCYSSSVIYEAYSRVSFFVVFYGGSQVNGHTRTLDRQAILPRSQAQRRMFRWFSSGIIVSRLLSM